MIACKRLIPFIIYLLLLWPAHGQVITTPDLNKSLIPPTPEAASLGKFGIMPVTLYEGMPNTSVPVFELKSASLTVPISLNYNYNGYRPGEEASWAGLGWAVQAGGVITRVVKGMVDDGSNVTYRWDQYGNNLNLAANQNFMAQVGLRTVDTEPDIYIFNFNGHSGKFVLINGRGFLFPHQDIKVTQVGTGFTIIDETGVEYSFQDIEVTTPNNSTNPGSYTPTYNSAWYLTRIISGDNTDTVSFQYANWSHRQYSSAYSESYLSQVGGTKNGSGCGGNNGCDVWSVNTYPGAMIGAKRLTSITCRSGYINFIPEDAVRQDLTGGTNAYGLKQIDIYNKPNNVLLKRVKLIHGYFKDLSGNSSQLKLSAVNLTGYYVNNIINSTVTSDSLVLNNYYTFQYANENSNDFPKTTRGIDMWGYYNGSNNNQSLFDASIRGYSPLIMPLGNRSVNTSKCTNGILTKIVYPTGGYTTFSYEGNRYNGGSPGSQHQNSQSTKTVTYNGTNNPTIGFNSFQINEAQTVSITYGRDISNYPNGVLNTYYILNIYFVDGDEAPPTLIYTSPRMNKSVSSQTTTLSLQPGFYSYSVSCESTSLSSSATISYYNVINIPPTGNPGPGMRVTSIQAFDNINNSVPASSKQYVYAVANPLSLSGYGQYSVSHSGSGGNYREDITSTDNSLPFASLINNQFYYPTVTEINRDSLGAGKTVYTYQAGNSGDALGVQLASQVDYAYVGGTLVPVKKKINNDTLINIISFWAFTYNIGEVADNGNVISPDILDTVPRTQLYQVAPYALTSAYNRMKSTDEITYDQNGANPMTIHTDYYYDNPNYTQATRTLVANSKGNLITTQNKYAMDYSVVSCTTPYVVDTTFRHNRDEASLNYQNCAWTRYQAAIPYWNASMPNWNNTALKNALRGYQCEVTYQNSYASIKNSMVSGLSNFWTCLEAGRVNVATTDANRAIILMQQNNIKTTPVEEIVSINKSGTDYLFAANKTDFTVRNTLTVAPKTLYQTGFASTSTTKAAFLANPSNYYQAKVNFKYDALDNIAEQNKTNDVKAAYLWDYTKMYPIAQASNADSADIAYSSFESDGTGTFTFAGAGVTGAVKGITGGKSYSLSSGAISRSGLNTAKTYVLSYWLKSGGSASVTGAAVPVSGFTKNAWTYYSTTTNAGASSVTISGSGNIDEVRLYPSDAQMTTYTYDPLIGETSICSPTNVISYYEYDPLGRLKDVRDPDLNVLKLIDYQYQNTTVYYNSVATGNFTRNNCPAGQFGSVVTYSVPAGRYSASTQAAADLLAQNDVTANGQAYANSNGTCTSTVSIPARNYVGVSGFTIKYTNTGTGAQTTFTISSTTAEQTLGSLLPGTYNVTISKTGNATSYMFGIHSNSCGNYLTVIGTSATFNNISINPSSCNDMWIDTDF